ncbi:hypothetical protein HW132_34705 [Brasilonema sp. CT11]|nr:hypothetical protein [Brasilonema sp. CT11]
MKSEIYIYGLTRSDTRYYFIKDSDGDGITNGVELGDPSCIWQQNQTPTRTTDITNPGLPDNPNNP